MGRSDIVISDLPLDDWTIAPEVELWRRLTPHKNWVIWDDGTQELRVSSAAFQNLEDQKLSVCITCDAPAGFTAQDYVHGYQGYGVAVVLAGVAREQGQRVIRYPEPNEVAHGHLVGNKSKAVRKKLAAASRLLIPTEDTAEHFLG